MDAAQTSEAEDTDYLPALEAALRYFGKRMDREALLAGLPLKDGRLSGAHVVEAASRAELEESCRAARQRRRGRHHAGVEGR